MRPKAFRHWYTGYQFPLRFFLSGLPWRPISKAGSGYGSWPNAIKFWHYQPDFPSSFALDFVEVRCYGLRLNLRLELDFE
jgi:hypothetical protein